MFGGKLFVIIENDIFRSACFRGNGDFDEKL